MLNLDNNLAVWDIKIVDSSGKFTIFKNQDINNDEVTTMNYYYKDGAGCISFGVG